MADRPETRHARRDLTQPAATIVLLALLVLEAIPTIRVLHEGPTLLGFVAASAVIIMAAAVLLYLVRFLTRPARDEGVVGSWLFLSLLLDALAGFGAITVVLAVLRLFNGYAAEWPFVVLFVPACVLTIVGLIRRRRALRATQAFARADERIRRFARLALRRYSTRVLLDRAPRTLQAILLLLAAGTILVVEASVEPVLKDSVPLSWVFGLAALALLGIAVWWSNRFCVILRGEGLMDRFGDLLDGKRTGVPPRIAAKLLRVNRSVRLAEASAWAESFVRAQAGAGAYRYAVRSGDCGINPDGLASDAWIFLYCLNDRRTGLEVAVLEHGELRTRLQALPRLLPGLLSEANLNPEALARGISDVRSCVVREAGRDDFVIGGELQGGMGLAEAGGPAPEYRFWFIWVTPAFRGRERLFALHALDGSVAELTQKPDQPRGNT